MRLALIGRGRMGNEVERLARAEGHEVVLTVGGRDSEGLTGEALQRVEVAIDFTHADAVVDTVRKVAAAGVPLVVGTTGWYDRVGQVREIVLAAGTGLVYGANFSIGANLFAKIVEHAAWLFDRFGEYDAYIVEHHHAAKRDAPSGTALRLSEILLQAISRKREVQLGNPTGPIAPDRLHVVSLRAGAAYGRHLVGFDSASDAIELVHTARSREGFARGALFAADWVRGKQGVFEFSAVLDG